MTDAPETVRRSLPERLSMDGRHALVTGAASGLGLAIAEGLLQCGASVTLLDRDGDELERTAAALAATGPVSVCTCDVTDPAAVSMPGPPAMRPAGRGSIVVTVSTAGLRADSMVGYGYSASKGALANLVRQAAVDLAVDGIRVNGIAPGPFHTNIGGRGPIDPGVEKAWSETVLLKRMGQRQEVQGIALLLASDASSFMTGAVYPVDGGALAGAF
jgi:NAD(P)-dependent dehydrogenase (short-subunit alcohol dehydrogenase family)